MQAAICMRLGVLILAVSSCSSSSSSAPEAPEIEPQLTWKALQDGSKAAVVERNGSVLIARDAARCWPEKEGYDCLLVGTSVGTGAAVGLPLSFTASRRSFPKLPDTAGVTDPGVGRSGYACDGQEDMIDEVVVNGTAKVISNAINNPFGAERPWSRAYVEKFMAENAIDPQNRWFDCRRVYQLFRDGSIETFSTTAATKRLLTG